MAAEWNNSMMQQDPGGDVFEYFLHTPGQKSLFEPVFLPSPPMGSSTSSSNERSPMLDVPNQFHSESPQDKSTLVSVSTTFYPGASNDPAPTNLIIVSSDQVFFYVHFQRLNSASENAFDGLLADPQLQPRHGSADEPDPIVSTQESSVVLNVVLHAAYDISCAHYYPTFDVLAAALSSLRRYGVPLNKQLAAPSPLHPVILAHAPTHPLEVYALAAENEAHELAVSCSPHLLSFSLPTLSDEMAARIGPIYLKKLFFLHLGRVDALKRLLLPPPHPHPPTQACDFTEQKKVTRAWALASAYLAWDARPDMSAASMESALRPLGDHLWCELCRDALNERVKNLVVHWSCVKRTI